jgi:sterol desaturase/sphingolipid hydroxylase (fatty acid hydroxylase superfamily)
MEAAIRFGIFVSIFVIVAVAEWRVPRRARMQTRRERWRTNLSILALDVIVQRFTLGAAAYATAVHAQAHGWGLFNALGWPPLLEALLAFLILDFAIYLQHVMSHALPVFWRLHQVHHADLDVDLTTGTRFHPLEILISLVWKALVVAALGADPWVVVVFEAVLNASAVYTHGNIRIPGRIDRILRWMFCTPDMHRVHHSVERGEHDRNFGFALSVWDRLFATYRAQPMAGHGGMKVGLNWQDDRPARLGWSLALPFRRA